MITSFNFLPRVWLAVGLAVLCWSVAQLRAAEALIFPADTARTGLTADPAWRIGKLANGVNYALRANSEPRGRVVMRLAVAAGSFHETEEQRGLAHFLEHLAFNGSTHFPPGTLVEFFQRMGMNFGGDTNAYTSFDRTVYMLDLPDAKPQTLREGLRVLADYSGELLLLPEEIERERGVILAEKLSRDSADYRALVGGYGILYDGTALPLRLPIGEESVIRESGRERFADFYDTWYRPERLAVIVVGDVDPAAVEPLLTEIFSPLAARGPARAEPDLGAPVPNSAGEAVRFGVFHEPEASSVSVNLQALRAEPPALDSAADRLARLPRDLAFSMVSRRFAELAKAEEAPFVQAGVWPADFPRLFTGSGLRLVSRPGRWADSMRVGENELRRALEHGFGRSELAEAKAELRNALEQAVQTEPTRRSEARADQLIDAFLEGLVPTTPAADLELLGPALEKVTVEECLAAFRQAWQAPLGRVVAVVGDLAGPDGVLPDAEALAQVYASAEQTAVTALPEREDRPWSYLDFGPAGEVIERREVADLGVTQLRFANGVRLNLKRTDFEAGVVHVRARAGDGQLTEPSERPGLAFFAGMAFGPGGLGRHSEDELRRILAGRNVGVGLQVADDAVVLSGQTTPADLNLQLQLLAATLTDAGYRSEAEVVVRRQLEPYYTKLASQPTGPLAVEVPRKLARGDHRFGTPSRAEAMARTLAELRDWLDPQLKQGALEVTVVGDIDPESVIAMAASTLGALPPRGNKTTDRALRQVGVPEPGKELIKITASVPKTVLACFWPTTDASEARRTRRLSLLGEVFYDRLRVEVREKLGGSYSPTARNNSSDTYEGRGFMVALATIEPGQSEVVRAAILKVAQDLARHGVTTEELERARLPLLTTLRETERSNAYWTATVLAASQEKPERLEWARTRTADFASISKAELDDLAKAYLAPEKVRLYEIEAGPAAP